MVAERGGRCTVVRAVDRWGDRQACWRLVDVRSDGPGAEGEIVRATVGVVRVAEPNVDGAARTDHERYRLIVELHASRPGVSEPLPAVVLDVVTVALAERMGAPAAVQDVRRDGLVGRIHAFIESHLGDPDLTPAGVAAAHHISLRYLQKLFEPESHGVAGVIRQRRLERCRDDLLDPAQCERPVAGIAARWGFSSAAHFSRVFREAYGLPPAAFRRAYHLGEAS
jgi:AraC-like DNA-binding protein